MMRILVKNVLAVLLIVVTVITGLSACPVSPARDSGDRSVAPFTDERVATVRIVMSAVDWDSTVAGAFAEEYVPADFWFDGELVPGVGVRPKGNSSLGQAVGWGSTRMSLSLE